VAMAGGIEAGRRAIRDGAAALAAALAPGA